MIILALLLFSMLFILSFVFELRELYYLSKYQRPDKDEEGCLYKYLISDLDGMTSANCRNKFYSNKFKKNNDKCPQRCGGQTYKDYPQNFETMTRTDKFFTAKKLLNMGSSVLGIILTLLNIIDKLS